MRITNLNNNRENFYSVRVENFKSQDQCDTVFNLLLDAGFSVEEYEEMELTVTGDREEYYSKKEFTSQVRATKSKEVEEIEEVEKNKTQKRGNKMETNLMQRCIAKAVHQEDVLFAHDAIEILNNIYKRRMERMKPSTIAQKIETLCLCNGFEEDWERIMEAAEDYTGYVGYIPTQKEVFEENTEEVEEISEEQAQELAQEHNVIIDRHNMMFTTGNIGDTYGWQRIPEKWLPD